MPRRPAATAGLLMLLIVTMVTVALVLFGDADTGVDAGARGATETSAGSGQAGPERAAAAGGSTTDVSRFDAREQLELAVGAPITPEYGPLLERSLGRVEIALEDAHGARLETWGWGSARTRTWRREGDWWQPAASSFSQYVVKVGGDRNAGLEPGEHETVVSLGSYGMATARYRVARGGRTRERLRMPGWRRVVTLRFVDQDGRPVPYLASPPHFSPQSTRGIPGRAIAPTVLRDPPGRERMDSAFEESWMSSSFSGSHGKLVKYATDDGDYCVNVIAGVGGEISMGVDSRYFKDERFTLESDFAGPEWDAYEVRLELQPSYADNVSRALDRTNKDPGRKSLHKRQRPRPTPRVTRPAFDPYDVAHLRGNRFRMVFSGGPDSSVVPVVVRNSHPSTPGSAGQGLWWQDAWSNQQYAVAASDRAFYRTEAQPVEHRGEPLVAVSLAGRRWPCVLSVRSSPTIAAWSWNTTFALTSQDGAVKEAARATAGTRAARRDGDRHVYETGLTDAWRTAILRSATLHCGISSHSRGTLSYDRRSGTPSAGPAHVLRLPLGEEARANLAGGNLSLDLATCLEATRPHPLVAFRCVGDRQEGVPWVEASIVSAQHDVLARTMRRASRKLVESGLRPNGDSVYAKATRSDEEVIEEEILEEMEEIDDTGEWEEWVGELGVITDPDPIPMPPLSVMRKIVGPEVVDAYGEVGLRRLWTEGAWYDTHNKLRSDKDGYVVSLDVKLRPGELYVLYLWSKSRDDLVPDQRIVFEARPGITDLGVIRVPSH